MSELSHLDDSGRVRMVDVSGKPTSARVAVAEGRVSCSPGTMKLVQEGRAAKGQVLVTAELAGVMAAKRCADLIPLCHPLPLSQVAVKIEADQRLPGFRVRAETRTVAATGVEMEALTAVCVACLTLYDMLKAADRGMRIENVHLVSKTGGVSGNWSSDTVE